MSEGEQVISQNKDIGARRHLCEKCLLDFLNHRFTRMSCLPSGNDRCGGLVVIIKINLLGFESHKYLFCDVDCFFFYKIQEMFAKRLCPRVLLLAPFPFPFSKVVFPENKVIH